jgi:hypothetical protein
LLSSFSYNEGTAIDLNLASGIYLLSISSENKKTVKKLIVN